MLVAGLNFKEWNIWAFLNIGAYMNIDNKIMIDYAEWLIESRKTQEPKNLSVKSFQTS